MIYKDAEALYKEALANTASPNRLLLYLYEKAIAHLKQAIIYSEKTPLKAKEKISYAYKILDELIVTFDSTEGELYQNLSLTHKPVEQKLSDIFFKSKISTKELQKIVSFLVDFKETWKKALKIDKQVAAIGNNLTPQAPALPAPQRNIKKGLNIRMKVN